MPYQSGDKWQPKPTRLVGASEHASYMRSSEAAREEARAGQTAPLSPTRRAGYSRDGQAGQTSQAAQPAQAGRSAQGYSSRAGHSSYSGHSSYGSHGQGYGARSHGAHRATEHASSTSSGRSDAHHYSSSAQRERSDEARARRAEYLFAKREEQKRRTRLFAIGGVVGAIVLILLVVVLSRGCSSGSASSSSTSDVSTPAAATGDAGADANPSTEPQPDPAEQRIEAVRVRAAANCTREQPSGLTDPAQYAELGRSTMERIVDECRALDDFDNAEALTLDGHLSWDGEVAPYLLAVNRAANVVTVYALDADGRYTVPYMSMLCSTGDYTPVGFYFTDEKYGWLPLFEEVYGQYATHIVGNILFHSVPYYNPYKDDLEYAEYNRLGTPASLGCVRLQACDVKWIFDMCPLGTPVLIYDDAANPGPMGRPGAIATNLSDTNTESVTYRGFDPTDPDPANPWDDAFRSGTAIRSDAAQAEWDAAQADGRWDGTINPLELLGYSTDAESRG
jgi:lipoprotein-anchoring transpeptidase ErfK/SrfK